MTKKDLQKMIYLSIKSVVNKEIKPLIERTIKKEFYKILNEADTAKKSKVISENKMSLNSIIEQDDVNDLARAEVNKKIFKGKTLFKENALFADVLNQTANEVRNNRFNRQNFSEDGQVTVNFNASENGNSEKDISTSNFSKEDFAAKLGYGDMEKIGGKVDIPNIKTKKKPKILENISRENFVEKPISVKLPTMSAGGEGGAPKPIDYSKVPATMVKNMMKNYSTLMKKVDSKVNRP